MADKATDATETTEADEADVANKPGNAKEAKADEANKAKADEADTKANEAVEAIVTKEIDANVIDKIVAADDAIVINEVIAVDKAILIDNAANKAIVANKANEANKAIVANEADASDNEVAGVLDNQLGLNFVDDGLGNTVDQFDKLVVVKANKQNNQQRRDAAKGRYANAKEVRGNVVAKDRGVSEEANRLHMLPFSLTKYSAIFAEVNVGGKRLGQSRCLYSSVDSR